MVVGFDGSFSQVSQVKVSYSAMLKAKFVFLTVQEAHVIDFPLGMKHLVV